MKTKVKRTLLLLVALLAITTLTGCPPTMPPVDKISAKEAWEIMKSAQETLPDDAVPVYIRGVQGLPESLIEDGKTGIWDIGFYSESEGIIWNVHLYNDADSKENILGDTEEYYTDVSLTVNDLTDWIIDSAEVCEIATQNGAGEVTQIRLYTARLSVLDSKQNLYKIPEFVLESTKLYWVICAGDVYYIDACTGEYLGSCTVIQLDSM